ncbi:hypothetical protein ACEPAG_9436 [Sanghuangporus baumii]
MLATDAPSSYVQPPFRSSIGQDHPAPEFSSSEGHDEFKATLEEMRSNHRGEVSCSIPVVDVESFLNYLFPPLHDGVDVESVVASLKDEGLITYEDEWKAFRTTSEKKGEEDENACLLFATIFSKVIDTASRRTNVEPNFVLAMQRNTSSSDRRQPGGYFILRKAEECADLAKEKRDKMRWWYDIALTIEFRKKDNSRGRNANVSKIVLNIQQTLALDPCRSEVFDFTKGSKVLTRIFLAIAFASKEELGWDPTVRPWYESFERNFDIESEQATGTRDYMAIETVDRSYSYLPSLNDGQAVAQLTAMLEMEPDEISAIMKASRPAHPRSDCFEFYGDGDYAEDRNMMRQLAFSNLFRVSDGHRWSFFNNGRIYDRDTAWIPESLHRIRKLLNSLRETLVFNYDRFEAAFPATRMDYLEEAHDGVFLHFEACRRSLDKLRKVLSDSAASQQLLSPHQDEIRPVQEPSMPSLEQDSGSSDEPFCDLEVMESESAYLKNDTSAMTTCTEQKRRPIIIDVSTPMPLLALCNANSPGLCATLPTNGGNDQVSQEPAMSHGYENATIEEMRCIVRGDRSYRIPEIEISAFVDNLLPPLQNGVDVESVVSSLKSQGLVTPGSKWKAFEISPSDRGTSEDVAFAPLASICDSAVVSVSKRFGIEPTFMLSLLSDHSSESNASSAMCPGGYFILREAEERARLSTSIGDKLRWWYDIALTTEFKKRESLEERHDNVSRIILNIQQTMSLDPCRRFAFGITVENTSMRLWFCSRATPVVSEVFNFATEVHLLTHIFLSIAFATKEQLGWDPTIRPFVRSNGERVYLIDVDDKTFETEQVLSDFSANALVSNATRVWKVRHTGSGDSFVLKDVWMEDDRQPERVIHDAILQDVEEKFGSDARREVDLHLLTPVADWLVPVHGEMDHTTTVMMRGYLPSIKRVFKFRVKEPKIVDARTGSFPLTSEVKTHAVRRELRTPFPWCLHRRKLFRRRHYRIVFKEIGHAFHAVKRLSYCFTVLRDCSAVLKWIHGCGWVHRDISVGNLYYYNGRGLIGDLEYAKHSNTKVLDESRTGTPEFMSIEAMRRCYMYCRPVRENDVLAEIPETISDVTLSDLNALFAKQPSTIKPTFFHNNLHDLESLWWVAVWVLFFCGDGGGSRGGGKRIGKPDEQRDWAASELFPKDRTITDRMLFFQNEEVFDEKVAWMPEKYNHSTMVLNYLRAALVMKLKDFESEFPVIRMDVLQGLQERFRLLFDACRRFWDECTDHTTNSLSLDMPYDDETYAQTQPSSTNLESKRPVAHSDARECLSGNGHSDDFDFWKPMPPMLAASHGPEPTRFTCTAMTRTLSLNDSSDHLAESQISTDIQSDMHRPHTPENRIRLQDEHLIKATPASYHSTHGHDFLSGGLDSMRDAVLRDFHYAVPEIDPESFVKNILPPLKDGIDIEDIVASLKSGGIITPDDKLKPFEIDPCKQKSAEDTVFAPLEDICRQVTLLATRTAPDVEQVFVLKLLPHVTPKSDRDSTTRPDAYFILKAVESQIMRAIRKEDKVRWWYDISPTGEFKKGNSPADRNDVCPVHFMLSL